MLIVFLGSNKHCWISDGCSHAKSELCQEQKKKNENNEYKGMSFIHERPLDRSQNKHISTEQRCH